MKVWKKCLTATQGTLLLAPRWNYYALDPWTTQWGQGASVTEVSAPHTWFLCIRGYISPESTSQGRFQSSIGFTIEWIHMKVDPHSSNPYFSKSTCICFICQLFFSDFIKGNKSVHHRLAQMQSVHLSRPQFYNNKVGVMPGMFCLTHPHQTSPPPPLTHSQVNIHTHIFF